MSVETLGNLDAWNTLSFVMIRWTLTRKDKLMLARSDANSTTSPTPTIERENPPGHTILHLSFPQAHPTTTRKTGPRPTGNIFARLETIPASPKEEACQNKSKPR